VFLSPLLVHLRALLPDIFSLPPLPLCQTLVVSCSLVLVFVLIVISLCQLESLAHQTQSFLYLLIMWVELFPASSLALFCVWWINMHQ
jgi:hypothetical protein